MEATAHYWAAAIFSGFASASDWRNWADRKIEECELPDDWIIALALASSEEDLLEPLGERMRAEEWECGHRIPIGNAKLGFIYWSFKLGRMSFAEFLTKAGDEADGGSGDLACEEVYSILNCLEQRQASGMAWGDLLNEADELFQPFWQIAKEQWAALGLREPSSA